MNYASMMEIVCVSDKIRSGESHKLHVYWYKSTHLDIIFQYYNIGKNIIENKSIKSKYIKQL